MGKTQVPLRPLADWIGLIGEVYQSGKPVMLILDYDGTLAPIVDDPDKAELPATTGALMRSMASLAGVHIGVISGRALNDVRNRVGLEGVLYAGSGGLELELAGVRKSFPVLNAITDQMEIIRRRLGPLVDSFSGAWIEKKPGCLAIHHRALTSISSAELSMRAAEILSLLPEVRFRTVSKAIEVAPVKGWHKGTAVEAMLRFYGEGSKSPPFPVYFGDAANDTEGMVAALQSGGVTVGVGNDAPAVAQHSVKDPEGLNRQLGVLLEVLEQKSNCHRQAIGGAAGSKKRHPTQNEERSVLIVDSDPLHGRHLAQGLEAEGWKVKLCSVRTRDAMAELAGVRLGEHTHILVDYMLPGFLASKLLARIRSEHPEIVGLGMVEPRQGKSVHLWPEGASNTVLTKPVGPKSLSDLVESVQSGQQGGSSGMVTASARSGGPAIG